MANPLYKSMGIDYYLTNELRNKWDMAIPYLKNKINGYKEIEPQQAEKFRYDFYGLLANILGMEWQYHYPVMKLNGYDASYCYDAKKLRIAIPDPSALNSFYSAFVRDL